MVALVEYVARRHGVVVQSSPCRLGHHQGVVGDHQFSGAGAADGVLDEAAAPVRAGGMNALAAAVGQRGDQTAAMQFRQPAGQVAALDVAVIARHAQRAIKPSGTVCWFMKPPVAMLTASSRFSRQR